jgi:very-short-patch-repair endonuclease
MGSQSLQNSVGSVWELAGRQHGVVTRVQLLSVGLSPSAIRHRVDRGRLHRVWPDTYAVGRPQLTQLGEWMAAALTCGPEAFLSHQTAAQLWRLRYQAGHSHRLHRDWAPTIHVSVPTRVFRHRGGIRLHRRLVSGAEITRRDGIPVTTPTRTLIDLAVLLNPEALEAAVNEADKLGLVDTERLRQVIEDRSGVDGIPSLRAVLDRRTFRLTDSELERRFLRLVHRAGLSLPRTRQRVNGFRVDFHWPELGLIVETDGLRYHRTPTQQSRDRIRDQAHTAAGFIALRFTHAQVAFEAEHVVSTLRSVAEHQHPKLF